MKRKCQNILSCLLIFGIMTTWVGCSKKEMKDAIPDEMPGTEIMPQNTSPSEEATSTSSDATLDNKICGFGFAKSQKGQVPDIGSYAKLIDNAKALYVGDRNEKKIYLTFDEGYENGFSAQILDTLKEKNCPAAFFVTGDYLKREPELIDRMIHEGHIVGNHTWNHPTLPKVEDETKFKEELTKLDDYLAEKHGIKTSYFRFPNGEFSQRSLKMVEDMGYKTVFWSVAYKDWERDVSRGADYAYENVVNHIHDGAILLLHAVSRDNADALGRIIDDLRKEGYEFCSLDELNFEK